MIYVLIGLGIIGFLPMIVVLYRKRRSDWLVKHGSKTEATVKMVHGYSSRSLNAVDIEYRVVETGHIIEKSILVAGSPYSAGDRFPIYYDPKNPRKPQVALKKGFIFILVFTLIIAAFVIFACFKLYEMT